MKIPVIVRTAEEKLSTLKAGDSVESIVWFQQLLSPIFGKLLYGEDVIEKDMRVDFENADGSFARLTLLDTVIQMQADFLAAARSPLVYFFPWIIELNFGKDNRRNSRNR